MEIIIADAELYLICRSNSNSELKLKIKKFINNKLESLQLSDNVIRNIVIATMKENGGRVETAHHYPIKFDVFFTRTCHILFIWQKYK